MANYLATDSDLTSVANAIRTKGGTSAALAFPADFVSAIAAIPSGGGGGFKCDYGSFTLGTDYNPAASGSPNAMQIPHDLGEVPKVVIVYPDTSSETPGTQGYMFFDRMVNLDQSISSVASRTCSVYGRISTFLRNDVSLVDLSNGGSVSYTIGGNENRKPTATTFALFRTANGAVWAAGDYKYFVSEGWWLK